MFWFRNQLKKFYISTGLKMKLNVKWLVFLKNNSQIFPFFHEDAFTVVIDRLRIICGLSSASVCGARSAICIIGTRIAEIGLATDGEITTTRRNSTGPNCPKVG